jgi:hypothetical protein
LKQVPEPKVEHRKSLWDRAYDDLRDENKKLAEAFEKILLAEPEVGPNASLNDRDTSKREKQMSTLVEKKLAIMNDKQWRIKVCGRSVEVREQVDKIVKIVLVAKDFISTAASLDPVHVGLPWAGVCILLPVGYGNFQIHLLKPNPTGCSYL